MKRILLLIAALFVAQPAFAREDVEVGSWKITAMSNETCAAINYVHDEGGSLVHVSVNYNAKQKYTYVDFTNTTATSLDDGAKVKLTIAFKYPNGEYDEGWGTADFDVVVMDEGTRMFTSQNLTPQMLDDFAKGSMIAFFIKSEIVSAYLLTGSAAAVTELRKCAFEVAGLNPRDPFLKADQ